MNRYKKSIVICIIAAACVVGIYLIKHKIQSAQPTQTIAAVDISAADLAQLIEAGFTHAEQGNYDAAIEQFKKALGSSLLTPEGQVKLITALGDAYFSKAYANEDEPNSTQDWQRSVDYFQQALSMKELPIKMKAFTEAKLGSMFLQPVKDIAPDEQKALIHLQRSLIIAELLPPEHAIVLTNIGSIYHNRADEHEQQKALAYYQDAIRIAKELENQQLIALLSKRIAALKK